MVVEGGVMVCSSGLVFLVLRCSRPEISIIHLALAECNHWEWPNQMMVKGRSRNYSSSN